jgi:hypothetical protein
MVGGTIAAARNVISGNGGAGVLIQAAVAIIQGNFIGTDVTGTHSLNNNEGVEVNGTAATNTLIGGTAPGSGNLISGGNGSGITFVNGPTGGVVEGNLIGTDVSGTIALGNGVGVDIGNASDVTVGGTAAAAGNLISGNSNGVLLTSNAMSNRIQGNLIGTDVHGAFAVANQIGIVLGGGLNNLIGGTSVDARNVISGNPGEGILVNGSFNSLIQGNYIGTDAAGRFAIANGYGIDMGVANNTIGGTIAGARNLISGNTFDGIKISASSTNVQGNYIGTDVTGTQALGNGIGVDIAFGPNNLIGGTTASTRNVVSGNRGDGIRISTTGNTIEGNYIGTDATGTLALGNQTGITMGLGASQNVIGGSVAAAGNVIAANHFYGIDLAATNATNNQIQGNFIGTNAQGTAALGNLYGIHVVGAANNTIGGTTAGTRNVISGNLTGVSIAFANGNQLQGNYIGIDVTGTIFLANGDGVDLLSGSSIVGGTGTGTGNVIGGNTTIGLAVFGSGNLIQGNFIGTDATGTKGVPNGIGVSISGSDNQVGGATASARNVISGSLFVPSKIGLQFFGLGATGNHIEGNFIGTDVTGTAPLPNVEGVSVESGASNNTIGGTAAGAGNLISGNVDNGMLIAVGCTNTIVAGNRIGTDVTGAKALPNGSRGVVVSGANTVIGGTTAAAGNVISGNTGDGLDLESSDNLVQGNFIGTNATGTGALKNLKGIYVYVFAHNQIGGTTAGARNLISGNIEGLEVSPVASDTLIQGNYIGTDVTGTAALANVQGVVDYGSRTVIGGTSTGATNLVSGNILAGIVLGSMDSVVKGNFIGTDLTGTAAVANGAGVEITLGSANTIGGTAPRAGNLISGNSYEGIAISGSANLVEGNKIGTDITGTEAVSNGTGISLGGMSNTVGGTMRGACNLISGNKGNGIAVTTSGNTVQGNYIGTDVTGTMAVPNLNGVKVTASANTIGGTMSGAGNTIAFNGQNGVLIETGTGNAIRRNVIIGHDAGLGIELTNGGNNNQAYPVLTSAISDSSSTTIVGTLASTPSTTFTIEFFADTVCNPSGYGEGERFLGSTTVTTDADGNTSFTFTVAIGVDPGQFISATATDPGNNTSAFSACMGVTPPVTGVAALTGLVAAGSAALTAELGPAGEPFLSLLSTHPNPAGADGLASFFLLDEPRQTPATDGHTVMDVEEGQAKLLLQNDDAWIKYGLPNGLE